MRVLFTLGSFAGLARAHVDSHAGEADALALQMMHGGMTETSTDDASNAVASMEQPIHAWGQTHIWLDGACDSLTWPL